MRMDFSFDIGTLSNTKLQVTGVKFEYIGQTDTLNDPHHDDEHKNQDHLTGVTSCEVSGIGKSCTLTVNTDTLEDGAGEYSQFSGTYNSLNRISLRNYNISQLVFWIDGVLVVTFEDNSTKMYNATLAMTSQGGANIWLLGSDDLTTFTAEPQPLFQSIGNDDICLAQTSDDDHRLVVYGNSCAEVNNEGLLNG